VSAAKKSVIKSLAKTSKISQLEKLVNDNGELARLALCDVELKALEQWRNSHFNKNANVHHVAHFAMLFALTNLQQFDVWIDNMVRYCDAEDIGNFAYLRSRLVALYSTKKLKIV
jgi:hypothetical protein